MNEDAIYAHLENDPLARACFSRIRATMQARGVWIPQYAIGLEGLAKQCSAYIHTMRQARALRGVVGTDDTKRLEEMQRVLREDLVRFQMIAPEREFITALTDEGLDVDIVGVCTPFDH